MNVLLISLNVIVLMIIILYLIIRGLSTRDNPKLFQYFVKRYEKQDCVKFPPSGSIVFTGSSVMKFWKTIESDLAPIPVINRGIAGAKIREVAYYVDRIVIPYKPKAVVLYAGSNDIQGSDPRTPDQVFNGYREFVYRVHSALPDVPVYYISIIPSPAASRWKYWNIINKTNKMIKEFSKKDSLLRFIDITDKFLDSNGRPALEYFKRGKIHLNEKGYSIWASVIKPVILNDIFNQKVRLTVEETNA